MTEQFEAARYCSKEPLPQSDPAGFIATVIPIRVDFVLTYNRCHLYTVGFSILTAFSPCSLLLGDKIIDILAMDILTYCQFNRCCCSSVDAPKGSKTVSF